MADEQQAWVVRMHTGGGDVVDYGVEHGLVMLGWSDADGLLACDDYWDFREIVHATYYTDDEDYRRSGQAASQLWNFLHEMRPGDLVVVPHGPAFYVATVGGPASREAFVNEGGCPYCLRTPDQRIAALKRRNENRASGASDAR